ncbi:hypothetical protein LSAT2_012014 [Lamellibrachia satsuma]|nr:hypothetical protein LSAT2_012014 [Lamellibrachia satsuma]
MASLILANVRLLLIVCFAVGKCAVVPSKRGQRQTDSTDNVLFERLTPCWAAEKAADGWTDAFIPSCTNTGQFELQQCQMFTRSCWCVDSITGEEIEGTSRQFHEGLIDCNNRRSRQKRNLRIAPPMTVPKDFYQLETAAPETIDRK